jgi:hypothetical protein
MTVKDFILFYNQTFIYLHERFGKSAVVDLWKTLAVEFGYKLGKMVEKDGIKGFRDFFYGEDGTAVREHVQSEVNAGDLTGFHDKVENCCSVCEILHSKNQIYRYYCEHCYWLYAYSLEKHGFGYDVIYRLQEPGDISCGCESRAWEHKDKK